jgi:hypothetical protein
LDLSELNIQELDISALFQLRELETFMVDDSVALTADASLSSKKILGAFKKFKDKIEWKRP